MAVTKIVNDKFCSFADFAVDWLHRGTEREGGARDPGGREERLLRHVFLQKKLRTTMARIGGLHQSRL